VKEAPLMVGLAVRDITPPLGYRLAGYYYERLATAVHDPLQAKAIVFQQGNVRFALVECDLCQTSSEVVGRARAEIERRTGIAADHVCIASTHTHTGPDYFGPLAEHLHKLAMDANGGNDPAVTVDYQEFLAGRIVEAVVKAAGDLRAAQLEPTRAYPSQISFNRRYRMKDGTVATNPGKRNPNILEPAGPVDPCPEVLGIHRAGSDDYRACDAILTNFPLHADTVGGTDLSADFPYYLEERLRRDYKRPNLVSIFAQGTSGNINHVNVATADPQKGFEEAEGIAFVLASQIGAQLGAGVDRAWPRMGVASGRVELPLQQYTPEEIASARSLFAKIQDRKLPFLVGVKAVKIVKIADRYHGGPISAQVQALRLSDDTAIVMVPSELFVEFGLEIKRRSPFAHTMVIELANDSFGYVPTKRAFEEGAYEPTNALIAPGGGEQIVELAVRLLGELKS
jgi:hypothetical protein